MFPGLDGGQVRAALGHSLEGFVDQGVGDVAVVGEHRCVDGCAARVAGADPDGGAPGVRARNSAERVRRQLAAWADELTGYPAINSLSRRDLDELSFVDLDFHSWSLSAPCYGPVQEEFTSIPAVTSSSQHRPTQKPLDSNVSNEADAGHPPDTTSSSTTASGGRPVMAS